jgi:hypothetical protein
MQIAEVNLCFSMLLFKNAKVQLMFADFTTWLNGGNNYAEEMWKNVQFTFTHIAHNDAANQWQYLSAI